MKLTNASSVPILLEFSVDSGTAVVFAASGVNDTGAALSDVVNTGASNGATKVTIIGAPSANQTRIVEWVNIYNGDSVTRTITVNLDVNGTDRILWSASLTAGQTLTYSKWQGWIIT